MTREAYLAAVAARLDLPRDVSAEVIDELRDHVSDATAALVDEGLDQDRALREALARLGSPDVLAEQLRRANQTPRRLLAGAGGGVWTAISEGFYSLVLGYLFMTLAAIVATVVVLAVLKLAEAAAVAPRAGIDLTRSTTLAAIVWAFAADRAGRAAVLVASARSRHRVAVVGPVVAVAGAAFLSWWAIVNVQLELDWPTAIAVLAIPIAFAVGALRARDGDAWKWRPRSSWRALAVITVSLSAFALGALALGPAANAWPDEGLNLQTAFHFERIGPVAETTPVTGGSWTTPSGRTVQESWEVDPEAIAGWRDLRIELWRAEIVDGPIATDAIRPVAVNGVEPTDGTIDATTDLPRYRDLTAIWVVLTGVTPDGRRLQLSDPLSSPATFNGTILDWFLAGDTPDR